MYICEVAAFPLWESCHLGICYFGKCTFGKLPLGKIPLESCRLGKAFGKVPNIVPNMTIVMSDVR